MEMFFKIFSLCTLHENKLRATFADHGDIDRFTHSLALL